VAFGLVTKLYIWPRLRLLERDDALVPLVVPHTFRRASKPSIRVKSTAAIR
jgi:hypothetical protein